ncbi:MAG: NUDIX hydrolase [Candidatus Nanopelagicales bacterium]
MTARSRAPGGAAHSDALRVLARWQPPSASQEALRRDYLEFLDAHPDATRRSHRHGHLTGSALVVDPSREAVLLTLHPLVGRWLQLGGHIEDDDASLRDAARREAVEEGGITDISVDPDPMRLDRHRVRCRDGRGGMTELHHLDVQFLALAPDGAVERMSSESLELRWWPWASLPEGTDASVRALVASARTRLGA